MSPLQNEPRSLSPAAILDSYNVLGEKKLSSPTLRLFLLGILAGFLIGMGAAVTNTATFAITNPSAAKIISALLFPLGLGIVMLTGAELFTGNCMLIAPVLDGKGSVSHMLRNWAAVYTGNFLGAILLALAMAATGKLGISGGALATYTIELATAKCSLPSGSAFVLGILCNILVCLGVLCSLSATDTFGRIAGAYLPVVFFVLCGFEHSVANMYYIPAGLFAAGLPGQSADPAVLSWGRFLVGNLLPVTMGNIAGGMGVILLLRFSHRQKAK